MIEKKEMKTIFKLQPKPLRDYLKDKTKEELIDILVEYQGIRFLGEEAVLQSFPGFSKLLKVLKEK